MSAWTEKLEREEAEALEKYNAMPSYDQGMLDYENRIDQEKLEREQRENCMQCSLPHDECQCGNGCDCSH